MKLLALVCIALASFTPGHTAEAPYEEHIGKLMESGGSPRKLKKGATATTKVTFKPPVDILIEAKTDSADLRLGYAATEVIFNWRQGRNILRMSGGPAGMQNKAGAGLIPINKYVTFRWLVSPTKQQIYVDGQLRFEHKGDYAMIDNPVSVFTSPSGDAEVTVKTIKVRPLAEPNENQGKDK